MFLIGLLIPTLLIISEPLHAHTIKSSYTEPIQTWGRSSTRVPVRISIDPIATHRPPTHLTAHNRRIGVTLERARWACSVCKPVRNVVDSLRIPVLKVGRELCLIAIDPVLAFS